MGQFKPMVKMMTTEPSVELKLKTGGSATFARMKAEGFPKMGDKKPVKKMEGGVMGALAGAMPMVPPMGAPGAARAMAAKRMARRAPGMAGQAPMPPMPARPAMKKGGKMTEGGKADMSQDKAMIKKAFKQHDMQEHEGGKGTSLKLKKGGKMATGGIAKSTKPGGYKTGGVVDGQGGYKSGGIIKSTKGSTKMSTAHPDNNSAPTGKVKMGNAGGYKKGGKIKMAEGGDLLSRLGVGGMSPGRGGGGFNPDGGGGDASSGLNSVNQGAQTIGGALKNIAGSVGMGGGGGRPQPIGMPGPQVPELMAKRGGKVAKKAFAAGGTINTGRPVAMPQGAKKPSSPVSIDRLAGTFKKGGVVC